MAPRRAFDAYCKSYNTGRVTEAEFYVNLYRLLHNSKAEDLIPLLKALKWQEVFSLNYLQTAQSGPYLELGAGIEHIFKLGRVDVFTSMQRNEPSRTGLRVGLGF